MAPKKQRMRGHAVTRPTVDEWLASLGRLNQASADFLKIDLDTALTFLQIARETSDDLRKNRNTSAARKAYQTVARLALKTKLRDDDRRIVIKRLEQVKSELEALGVAV